jgi:hypothetical protein
MKKLLFALIIGLTFTACEKDEVGVPTSFYEFFEDDSNLSIESVNASITFQDTGTSEGFLTYIDTTGTGGSYVILPNALIIGETYDVRINVITNFNCNVYLGDDYLTHQHMYWLVRPSQIGIFTLTFKCTESQDFVMLINSASEITGGFMQIDDLIIECTTCE